jgi:hypothetical protein
LKSVTGKGTGGWWDFQSALTTEVLDGISGGWLTPEFAVHRVKQVDCLLLLGACSNYGPVLLGINFET